MATTKYEILTELIKKLGDLRNEIKWAERNPDDANPDIGDKAGWKARVNEAKAKVDAVNAELRTLLDQLAKEL